MVVGLQTFTSRRDDDTSLEGTHRAPIWEQEFQFLVEDFKSQVRTFSNYTKAGSLGHRVLYVLQCQDPAAKDLTCWIGRWMLNPRVDGCQILAALPAAFMVSNVHSRCIDGLERHVVAAADMPCPCVSHLADHDGVSVDKLWSITLFPLV